MTRNLSGHSEDSLSSAALFALDLLRGEEKTAFERHVQEGCEFCEQDLAGLAMVAENLAFAAPPAEPSPAIRQRLVEFATAGNQKSVSRRTEFSFDAPSSTKGKGILLQHSGLLISRSSDMPWESVAPGFFRKTLFVDPERKYTTCLLRVEAGSRYPSHRHADVEEILVLEGDLNIHGVSMRAGDYCRAQSDSIHEETFTESGCLLLQLTSQLDQIQG
jgi:ChrR-like protein with cupin domain